jgi:hypothetical protein
LLLGGALAHFFGGSKENAAAQPTVAALPTPLNTPASAVMATPTVSPKKRVTATPSAQPSATRSSSPAPTAHASPERTAAATASASPAAKPEPSASKAVAVPTPQATPTKAAIAAKVPAATSAPAGSDRAVAIVRSYLSSLAHGDRAAAAGYLAHGLPNETFMSPGSHIESIRSSTLGSRQYHVTADVVTASGEYYALFRVEEGPSGLQITDHYSIKQ